MCIRWNCQCSNKRQSVPILFLWSMSLLGLFSDSSVVHVPLPPWLDEYTPLSKISCVWSLLFLITICVLFSHGNYDYYLDVYIHGHSFWTDLLLEYWMEHVTIGCLYVKFVFSTRVLRGGSPGFATDCPSGVWCCRSTTCLLYVGPLFGNLVLNNSCSVSHSETLFFIVSYFVDTYL